MDHDHHMMAMAMDHTGMDHGDGGMDHGDHTMPMVKCAMNMLWNTQIIDTCIVFRSWHISSHAFFLGSCIAIVGLGVLYEYLRAFQKSLDIRIALALLAEGKGKARARSVSRSGRSSPDEDAGLLTGRRMFKIATTGGTPVPFLLRLLRAGLYGATVFLSFFLMLVFMTYNAYLILATVLGAALGHFIFGGTIDIEKVLGDESKGMACH
ncbi:FAD-binding FR-type domain-containing protein [Mycena chlorophos]|uniref:Copper transport protein n=1 Tax=Mycena chlorophos TaxID=658473 RepID=A0A8H6WFE9_MYCCL|nr:FAD-binding FR-type domain-containing protein [Mycena chlorophos]